MAHGVTPEPPPGSEQYREGWRHGYEQRELDDRRHDIVRITREQLHRLERAEVASERRGIQLARLERSLAPLCPCVALNSELYDGAERDCPAHGDGVTFVGQVRALRRENVELRRELEQRRASVTTGGPAPAFTRPAEQVVQLPHGDTPDRP